MAQLASDARDTGYDLLHDWLGDWRPALDWTGSSFFNSAADPWLIGSVVFFVFVLLPFGCDEPWLRLFVRGLWLLTFVFILRTCTLLGTRYAILSVTPPYRPPSIPGGAVLLTFGVHVTQSDLMFSGHTSLWVLMACFFWQHRRPALGWTLLALFYWAVTIGGILVLVATRRHYTDDMVVGATVAVFVAVLYQAVRKPESTYAWHAVRWLERDWRLK